MSKPSAPSRPRLDGLPTAELIARGQSLMTAQNYKDAIDVYKLLLKREPQPEAGWRNSLASAYLERAKQLAGKAMYREAAVIWENLPGLCGQAQQPELYIGWLLQTGQYGKAMRAYAQHADRLTGASDLGTRLAALALAGQKEVLQTLPSDAPLRRQLASAQAALRAYGQGDPETLVREQLQGIPIRSPYLDLRQILMALLKLETAPAEAPALVERLTPASPWYGLAEIVRVAAAPKPAQALLELDQSLWDLGAALIGLEARQIKLLKDWKRLGDEPSAKAQFDFIAANLGLLDHEAARRAALSLLSGYPKGRPQYLQLFGPIPPLDTHRLAALHAEQRDDSRDALHEWQVCLNLLLQNARDPDQRLMIALTLRHMAELSRHQDHFWGESSKRAEYLEKSLEFDPDDRNVYLQLAELSREAEDAKTYHSWVERAVKQFPDDPQVLMAAVATATARKSYKKAAGFAKRVLDLDPINTRARTVLINSHLAHARKQLRAGKFALVEKELTAASQLERDTAHTGVIEIQRGLLAFRQRQRDQTRHWLQEGVRRAGSPVLGWMRMAVEASRLDLEPEQFQRDLELGDPGKFTVSHGDLLTIMKGISSWREEGVEDLDSVLEDIEKPLKKAIKELRKEEELLLVCEALHQAPHYELLEYAATGALNHHPERPLFLYYQLYGRAEGDADELRDRDVDRLEAAIRKVKDPKDQRAKILIMRFLEERDPDFDDLVFNRPAPGPRGIQQAIEEMREALEAVPPMLREKMLNMMLADLPDDDEFPPELVKKIMKEVLLEGKDPNEIREDLFGDEDDDEEVIFPRPARGGRRRKPRR